MTTEKTQVVLVYDVGGSHVSASAYELANQKLGPVAKIALPPEKTAEAFETAIVNTGKRLVESGAEIAGVCLAIPGPFDYATGVSRMKHKFEYLYDVDLKSHLAQSFALAPALVRFLNDANAFGMGEAFAGAAQGAQRAVVMTLGTGIGSAFVVEGIAVSDGPGVPNGGEIWNIPYEEGIVETALSTEALQKNYERESGERLTVEKIAERASGDRKAAEVFEIYGRYLGKVAREVLSGFGPEVIVLGGGISRSSHLFLAAAMEGMEGLGVRFALSALGDEAPLYGAAAGWLHGSR